MAELKPIARCPFCGSETGLYSEAHEEGYHTFFHVHCICCDAYGPDEIAEQKAISAWNKRS